MVSVCFKWQYLGQVTELWLSCYLVLLSIVLWRYPFVLKVSFCIWSQWVEKSKLLSNGMLPVWHKSCYMSQCWVFVKTTTCCCIFMSFVMIIFVYAMLRKCQTNYTLLAIIWCICNQFWDLIVTIFFCVCCCCCCFLYKIYIYLMITIIFLVHPS